MRLSFLKWACVWGGESLRVIAWPLDVACSLLPGLWMWRISLLSMLLLPQSQLLHYLHNRLKPSKTMSQNKAPMPDMPDTSLSVIRLGRLRREGCHVSCQPGLCSSRQNWVTIWVSSLSQTAKWLSFISEGEAGKMTQQWRTPGCFSKGPRFDSQNECGGSQ